MVCSRKGFSPFALALDTAFAKASRAECVFSTSSGMLSTQKIDLGTGGSKTLSMSTLWRPSGWGELELESVHAPTDTHNVQSRTVLWHLEIQTVQLLDVDVVVGPSIIPTAK